MCVCGGDGGGGGGGAMQLPANLFSCDGGIVLPAPAACTDGRWGTRSPSPKHLHEACLVSRRSPWL